MSEGNLSFLNVEQMDMIEDLVSSGNQVFIYSKSTEIKKKMIDYLKKSCEHHEIYILDSTKYKQGEGSDIESYKDDLKGVPEIANGLSFFNGHEDLPHEREVGKQGFLIIDNIDKAEDYIVACIDALFDRGTLMNYKLPEGWGIIAIADSLDFKFARSIMNRGLALGIK